jgi:hypothetical protein
LKPVLEEPEKIFTPPPPVAPLPREEKSDTNAPSCSKFRKPKPAPRLNVSRTTLKINVSQKKSFSLK